MKKTYFYQKAVFLIPVMLVFICGFFLSTILPPFTIPLYIPGNAYCPRFLSVFNKAFSNSLQSSQILYHILPLVPAPKPASNPPAAQLPDTDKIRVIQSKGNNETLLTNSSGYEIDTDKLLGTPLPFGEEKPAILILHTHTSEAYTPSEKYNYVQSDIYRSEDAAFNVTLVGTKMKEVFSRYNIEVIHDTTSHDFPSYSGSYKRSLETATRHIENNPRIKIVLDIHRDAIADDNGYFKTLAEEGCAQAMLVVGTDKGGLEHPTWQKNLSLALHLQKHITEKFPNLMRPLDLREERFNGHISEGAMIIEIGSCGNTMEEALLCAERTAEGIADMLSASYSE